MAANGTVSWKQRLHQQLKQRNRQERHTFDTLIESQNKLFDAASSLKNKNVHLTVELERVREENLSLQIKADSGGGGGGGSNSQLEQKLYRVQEELTELHRNRGENAQKIIDLSNLLQEKERELQTREAKLLDAAANEHCLKAEIRHLEANIMELEATNQMLKDEHQALQLAFSALEGKYRKAQDDNRELVERWMAQKLEVADKINDENDRFMRKRHQKLQSELAEAANEPVNVTEDTRPGISMAGITPICLSTSLPSHAQCKIEAHEGEVNAVQWSPTGSIFATGGGDRKIKLWDYSNGHCTNRGLLTGSNAGITAIDFDLEEQYVLGASNDHASRLWSLHDRRVRHALTGHSAKVLATKFLGDSTKVVSGSHDRTLKVWDLHSKACIKTLFAGSSCNDLVTLHSNYIISGHFDKRVRFWDTRSDNTTNEIMLQGRIASLALSPERTSLLACVRDDTLKVIDLRMNQVSQTLCAENFKVGFDWTRAVFSPDGSYAMAGSMDGTLFIWNLEKGKVERALKEHNHAIIACSWHPTGSYVLSSEKQKCVIVWSDI